MFQFDHLAPARDKNDPLPAFTQKGMNASLDRQLPAAPIGRSLGNQALNQMHANDAPMVKPEPTEAGGAPMLRSILRETKGSGASLAEPIKTFMEASLYTNLERVRIHTDSRATAMAEGLGAAAFTYGRNVYFNTGRYDPATAKGARLLAHELVHTIQQGFHDSQIPNDLPVSSPEETSEQQADQVAARITSSTSLNENKASTMGSIKTQLIQPKIQRARNIDVAIYETKDHGTGYEDAPDESYSFEANSLTEAGNKLNGFVKAMNQIYGSTTAISLLSFYGHGAPGSQSVGAGEGYDSAKEISVASIASHSNDYKQIYTPLSNGASVYLRGCNVGAGDEGLKLLKEIKSSCKTLTGKDIEAYGWTGKSFHMRRLAYDWYEQTGERVSSSDKTPKITWEKLKERKEGKKK